MRDPGKLLFRVGHLSCLKGVMAAHGKIISSLHQMIPAREGYDIKLMDGGIDARPYEVASGVECPSSNQPTVDRIEQRDNPHRQK